MAPPTPRVLSFRESRTLRYSQATLRYSQATPRCTPTFPHARCVFPTLDVCFPTLDGRFPHSMGVSIRLMGVSIRLMGVSHTRWVFPTLDGCLPKRTRTRGTRSFVVSVDLDMGYILQEILKIYKNFFYFFENFSKKKVLKKIIFLF